MPTPRRIILSGCSGGGKSTLLDALAAQGQFTLPEPGRRVVQREQSTGGTALPWTDAPAFARACIALALQDLATMPQTHIAFFDRSLHDATLALQRMGQSAPPEAALRPYTEVILFPPWPELRQTDAERRGDMDQALAEYDHLAQSYPLMYPTHIIPRASLPDRLAWLSRTLGLP